MRLVLFDIDGTLLVCGRQVRRLFAAGLEEVYGTAGPIDAYEFSGKTDHQILFELLGAAGLPLVEVRRRLETFREVYLDRLDAGLRVEEMTLLPGVEELLARLQARKDVRLGLVTGNWERGARIKLGRFDLNRYFAFGAFGDGQPDRGALPALALERAALHGGPFRAEDALMVGDSLLDVACARAHGIPSLAVATGWTSAESLAAAGADWVVTALDGALPPHPVFSPGDLAR